MKKTIIQTLTAARLLTAGIAMPSHPNMVEDVSLSVAKAILGQAADQVFGMIFGSGSENTVSIEEIKGAIDDAFNKANSEDIQGEYIKLSSSIRIYNPDPANTQRATDVGDVLTQTSAMEGIVRSHISKSNSMVAIPAFVSA